MISNDKKNEKEKEHEQLFTNRLLGAKHTLTIFLIVLLISEHHCIVISLLCFFFSFQLSSFSAISRSVPFIRLTRATRFYNNSFLFRFRRCKKRSV